MGVGAYTGTFSTHLGALSFISVLIAVLCYGGAWWVARSPTAFNMPNQAAYDALPEESQRKVVACTLPFFYWSTTIWLGFLIVGFSFETTAALVVAAVLANIAEGALAIRFLFLKAPRKVREFQEAGQDRSG
ncbi:hypothetical protein GGQ14_001798 [Salinibacter ruber]|nr:hypothetical protein [Salinibacter ruber]